MLFAHDENSGKSEFLILDASDFSGKPVARVKLPSAYPTASTAAGCPTRPDPTRSLVRAAVL